MFDANFENNSTINTYFKEAYLLLMLKIELHSS